MINADFVREIERLAVQEKAVVEFEISDPRGAAGGLAAEGKIPVFVDMKSGEVTSLKGHFDEWRKQPDTIKGTANAHTLAGFCDLVGHHKTDRTRVFLDGGLKKPSLVAVIDYHAAGGTAPSWNRHRVHYAFPMSTEFQAWTAKQATLMPISDFAELIEDRIAHLSSPMAAEIADGERMFGASFATPAEMLRLSRGLQVRVNATVSEARTLQSGESEIIFTEEHKDADGKKLSVPGLFMLNIPLFDGDEPTRIMCRLRYRVFEQKIKWAYQIYDLDNHIKKAIEDSVETVKERLAISTFMASPEV